MLFNGNGGREKCVFLHCKGVELVGGYGAMLCLVVSILRSCAASYQPWHDIQHHVQKLIENRIPSKVAQMKRTGPLRLFIQCTVLVTFRKTFMWIRNAAQGAVIANPKRPPRRVVLNCQYTLRDKRIISVDRSYPWKLTSGFKESKLVS
jgi:hypothetical protein